MKLVLGRMVAEDTVEYRVRRMLESTLGDFAEWDGETFVELGKQLSSSLRKTILSDFHIEREKKIEREARIQDVARLFSKSSGEQE